MKHLVVGLDHSSDAEASFTWARGAVGAFGTIHIVHAVPSNDDRSTAKIWLTDRITGSGIPSDRITGEVVVGDPADRLVGAAARIGATQTEARAIQSAGSSTVPVTVIPSLPSSVCTACAGSRPTRKNRACGRAARTSGQTSLVNHKAASTLGA